MVTVPCIMEVGQSIMYHGGRMVTVSCTVEVGQSTMYRGSRTEYHVSLR